MTSVAHELFTSYRSQGGSSISDQEAERLRAWIRIVSRATQQGGESASAEVSQSPRHLSVDDSVVYGNKVFVKVRYHDKRQILNAVVCRRETEHVFNELMQSHKGVTMVWEARGEQKLLYVFRGDRSLRRISGGPLIKWSRFAATSAMPGYLEDPRVDWRRFSALLPELRGKWVDIDQGEVLERHRRPSWGFKAFSGNPQVRMKFRGARYPVAEDESGTVNKVHKTLEEPKMSPRYSPRIRKFTAAGLALFAISVLVSFVLLFVPGRVGILAALPPAGISIAACLLLIAGTLAAKKDSGPKEGA